jgi:hypothetical protein
MCGILNRGVANSFLHHLIQISSRQMYFQDIYSNLWKVKVFIGNIYALKSNTYFWGTVLFVQDGFLYLIVTKHKLTVYIVHYSLLFAKLRLKQLISFYQTVNCTLFGCVRPVPRHREPWQRATGKWAKRWVFLFIYTREYLIDYRGSGFLREHLMYYRIPGFLAVVWWYGSYPLSLLFK